MSAAPLSQYQTDCSTNLANHTLPVLGKVHLPLGMQAKSAELERWDKSRRLDLEPTVDRLSPGDKEWHLVVNARKFISAERLQLGINSELPNTIAFRSRLWSESGFAGQTHSDARTYTRYPAYNPEDENELINLALHVHEVVHATGILSIVRANSGSRLFDFGRCGWSLCQLGRNELFAAFEEYSASVMEGRFLKTQGFVEGKYGIANQGSYPPCFKSHTDVFRALEAKIHSLVLSKFITLTESGCTHYLGGDKVLEHHNLYSQLVILFDLLARELYDELPVDQQIKAFRDDCIRVQAGSPYRLVMSRVREKIGVEGVKFLSCLGQTNKGLFDNSEEIALLRLFVQAGYCEPQVARRIRGEIQMLQSAFIEDELSGVSRIPSSSRVAKAIEEAIASFKENRPRDALAILTISPVCGAAVSQNQRFMLLASLYDYPLARRAVVMTHLYHSRIISPRQFRVFENEQERLARREQRRLTLGVFEPNFNRILSLPRSTVGNLPTNKWQQGMLNALLKIQTDEALQCWCKAVAHLGLATSPPLVEAFKLRLTKQFSAKSADRIDLETARNVEELAQLHYDGVSAPHI